VRSLVLLTVFVVGSAVGLVHYLMPEAEAEATERAVRPQEVQSVAIDGPRNLPLAAMRAELATHAGDLLDATKLDHDRSALERSLVARGYLDAKAQPAQVSFDSGGGAYVTFSIAHGPLFHVRAITVTGATPRDAGVVTLAVGETVVGDRIERAREALADRLAARGKPGTVAVALHVDEAAAAVDVELSAH
jgi:outer membrane protein assembly factor BamA